MKAFSIGADGIKPLTTEGLELGQVVSYGDMANQRRKFVIVSTQPDGMGLPAISVDGTHKSEITKNQLDGPGGWRYEEDAHWDVDAINNLMGKFEVERNIIQQEAKARKEEEERVQKLGEQWLENNQPEWAKAIIVAEVCQDESDITTDYFESRTERVILLAWSKSGRNNFNEMRKAAKNCPETEHLSEAPKDYEHRENYTGGEGYYLAHGWGRSLTGYKIKKMFLSKFIKRDIAKAVANNDIFIPEHKLEPEQDSGVKIVDYSEKAIAVIGDTKPIKDTIKELGGRFNKNLEIDGQKTVGWVFPKTFKKQVKETLNI